MKPGVLRTGLPLWAEITLVLLLKIALLWGAKTLWFSEPLTRTKKMSVPQSAISQQLIGPAAAASTRPEARSANGSLPEDTHAARP
ncbi:hypothetical protein [Chitinolyticbacter meiyuanensis]|uniref:hypothetical protein n=1 Tax=Chitinolyticbacter meiyuanensis TaxID=682798 RepID=UPI0011E5DCCF|nr:hypothetical protein [Chitinolyticbacter meiyuanensis]